MKTKFIVLSLSLLFMLGIVGFVSPATVHASVHYTKITCTELNGNAARLRSDVDAGLFSLGDRDIVVWGESTFGSTSLGQTILSGRLTFLQLLGAAGQYADYLQNIYNLVCTG